ncbi:hypothetical protein TGPRC2_217640 [Toxoplasma gondii TgCatPRC2]|uniref:Uncharacterized protein n=15 Tax=Toxoplasma gondii TaxID=5811 RepID=B9PQ91_TOXGV|nr:hypothetical protein TGME49_217640 [Toxoplasma gondii ME49]EPR63865.1 hypothetical protein TGGT1_217640 [Toxoplasma gondii GT1]ESS34097.1 hypothetical protein TGVEG_217640 [Toxoplasma gondii VEG]KAF4638349.1 hypothetical protein TGRH88_059560 [Toxoplasma gondii]KFG37811.1 hypothetical protein TGP89_217640 [Toxoplasma gondii p89]KFG47301.1 hypothetical protein TGDOM2_217640 [Toxoplasma gondii GAB2-2007-GAL-DOM2]KFG50614.1 hypothetical protein TGFOU_217640 [Toxoplasma gondii FOU]KFG64729.1 |eukprot:XP_018634860.1 hypothetical protein TGME49_217640 [Toxoplasma gondii ME49]
MTMESVSGPPFLPSTGVNGYSNQPGVHQSASAPSSPMACPSQKGSQQKDPVWLIGDSRFTSHAGARVNVERLYPGYVVHSAGRVVFPDESGYLTAEAGATYELKDCLSTPVRSMVTAYSSIAAGSCLTPY